MCQILNICEVWDLGFDLWEFIIATTKVLYSKFNSWFNFQQFLCKQTWSIEYSWSWTQKCNFDSFKKYCMDCKPTWRVPPLEILPVRGWLCPGCPWGWRSADHKAMCGCGARWRRTHSCNWVRKRRWWGDSAGQQIGSAT